MNLLVLIDSRVQDITNITNSFTTNTEYVIFDFFNDTFLTLQEKITKSYDSVAIIQHNYRLDVYRLLLNSSSAIIENIEEDDPELNTWQEYIDFLLWLKNDRGATHIDLMACNLWSIPGWRYMIETVRTKYGIYIRASIDITGEGGNFILESDNFNTIGVYFTADILNYKYAFYSVIQSYGQQPYQNYVPYILPDNNLATVSSRYRNLLGASSSTKYTNVKQVTSGSSNSALLLSNGNVVVVGDNTYGGLMPCGIVTQSDLVNISKIVANNFVYVALKNDGTVISWGYVNGTKLEANDINTVSNNANIINVNSVRSQLVNVVDIYANCGQYGVAGTYAALKSDGSVVTWGHITYGGNQTTAATYLSSGITKIVIWELGFFALKNDGSAVRWGNNSVAFSTTYFAKTIPIVDAIADPLNGRGIYIRKNGNALDLILYTSSSPFYTLPVGVTILRKHATSSNFKRYAYFLFSNNTLGYLSDTNVWTLYTNVTDVAVNNFAFAYIQNGTVVVSGNNNGGSLTDAVYGLKSGANLNNPVRLVSSSTSIGCIKSDNTFVWWGRITVPYVTYYYSATFPTNAAETTLYNATTNQPISNVYPNETGYAVVRQDGSMAILGPNSSNGVSNTTNYDRKDASTNVYFELTLNGFIALEIPYLPSVSPNPLILSSPNGISYYPSNPDKMAYQGRKYNLYNGSTLIDTFVPTVDTHTYLFPNVKPISNSEVTLTIKDETTIAYVVETFKMMFDDRYPCFLEGSKILCLNPDTYQEEYIAVEKLRKGDVVVTAESGYKAVHSIGSQTLHHPKSDKTPSNRLYKFSKKNCPTVFKPLYITGEHSTLHRHIPEEKRKKIIEHMDHVFTTEEFYRMPAFLDDRAEPYDGEDKPVTIWHFALEHKNEEKNYGVYANGLLVESCAIKYLAEKSGMSLVE